MRFMRLTAYGATDHGRRRAQNQDSVLSYTMPSSGMPVGLYAVADGMGGQNAGEVASQITIDTIRDDLLQFLDQSVGVIPENGSEVVTGRLSESEPTPEPPNLSMVDALTEAI